MSDVRAARRATAVTFAVHGAVVGSFATRIPWIAQRLGTDPGGLGLALLFVAVGAMVSMPFSGRILHRYRIRPVIRVLLTLWCLSLMLPALAPNVPALCVAMFIYGVTSGMSDVAMNAEGVIVEQRAGKSIMSGLHGMWSAGGLIGSAVGVLAAQADIDARVHFAVMAVVLAGIGLAVSGYLIDDRAPESGEDAPAFSLPSKPVILIALVGFAAVFAEGAAADWAAVYLTDVAHAAPALAAAAFSGFAATMAVTRLVGDRVVDRFGPVNTIRCGGVIATIGALLVSIARVPAVAIPGFALIGLGVAVVVPLAFAAAGNAGPNPGHQIAGVATIAYGAGLIAPAAIGGIAHATSLSLSFVAVSVLTAVVAVGAPALRRRSVEPVEPAASQTGRGAATPERPETDTSDRSGRKPERP